MEVNLYNTNKKYNVIYADPPWSYQQWCNKKQGAAKAHYETMKQKDIEELPVERSVFDCDKRETTEKERTSYGITVSGNSERRTQQKTG